MNFALTLVRHGQSTANVRHMLAGWKDVELTETGRKELEKLASAVDYPESDIYFSSPLKRCRETAEILFPGRKIICRDEFREINFRMLEGWILSSKEEMDAYFADWVNDEAYLDEETLSDVMERGSRAVLSTVAECEAEGLHSATVVMHSGLMRACLVALFGLEREDFNRMSVANGLGVVIDFDGLSPVRWTPLQRRA